MRDAEVNDLQNQVREQAAKLQRGALQKQRDNERMEKIFKDQLTLVESEVNKKDLDLKRTQDEANEEYKNMDTMRQTLNSHIIYLQNEVRKRDEMLDDNDSDSELDSFADESGVNTEREEVE